MTLSGQEVALMVSAHGFSNDGSSVHVTRENAEYGYLSLTVLL
jgi:hypothetical protein